MDSGAIAPAPMPKVIVRSTKIKVSDSSYFTLWTMILLDTLKKSINIGILSSTLLIIDFGISETYCQNIVIEK